MGPMHSIERKITISALVLMVVLAAALVHWTLARKDECFDRGDRWNDETYECETIWQGETGG